MWESAVELKQFGFVSETVGTSEELDRIGTVRPQESRTGRDIRNTIDRLCDWCGVVGDVLEREADLRRHLVEWAIQLYKGGAKNA